MAELVVQDLLRTFGTFRAVDDVSFTVADGEFLTLLGPSGCGKSTTLAALAGLDRPEGGRIALGDRIFFDQAEGIYVPPEQREVGLVFQSYALWPHMNVADNVGYPLKLRRLSGEAYRRQVAKALAMVALTPYAERSPQELSGGQRQRVALARCLVTDPDVVLLDEPLANLDRHLRAAMEQSFRDFHRRTRSTLVYVTHDQSEAMALADRIAVMRDGRLEQWATPEVLYRQPRTAWVASFIGQGSLLNIAAGWPGKRLEEAVLMRGLAAAFTERTQPVLVRPEHVMVLPDAPSPQALRAQVEGVTFRGERYELHLRLESGEALLAYHQAALGEGRQVGVIMREGWCLEPEA